MCIDRFGVDVRPFLCLYVHVTLLDKQYSDGGQDWSVNKRRVKRLLRSMNNDAWKTAVSPTLNASSLAIDEPAGSTSTRAVSDGSATEVSYEKKASSRGKLVSKRGAFAAASKSGAPAAFPGEERKDGNGAGLSSGGDVCETAPASPGSPISGATVCRSSGTTVCSAVAEVAVNPRMAIESLKLDSAPKDTADAAPVPREGALPPEDGEAEIDETARCAVEGEGEDDALVDSLRLEPDFELEAASIECLKADLGLLTTADEGEFDENAVTGCTEDGGVSGGGGDDNETSGRSDDHGFEIIERAEALAAPVTVDDAVVSKGTSGRKGWSWSWSRS